MNPFVYNQPVKGDDFFDREDEVQRILKETVLGKSQGSVWITGERQVGKTSLLQYLRWHGEEHRHEVQVYGNGSEKMLAAFVFVNVQDCRTEAEFYRALAIGLRNYFDFKTPESDDDFLAGLREAYQKRGVFTGEPHHERTHPRVRLEAGPVGFERAIAGIGVV